MVGDKEVGGDLPTIADDLVVTKYKMAAEIVNSKFLSGLVLVLSWTLWTVMLVYLLHM